MLSSAIRYAFLMVKHFSHCSFTTLSLNLHSTMKNIAIRQGTLNGQLVELIAREDHNGNRSCEIFAARETLGGIELWAYPSDTAELVNHPEWFKLFEDISDFVYLAVDALQTAHAGTLAHDVHDNALIKHLFPIEVF